MCSLKTPFCVDDSLVPYGSEESSLWAGVPCFFSNLIKNVLTYALIQNNLKQGQADQEVQVLLHIAQFGRMIPIKNSPNYSLVLGGGNKESSISDR